MTTALYYSTILQDTWIRFRGQAINMADIANTFWNRPLRLVLLLTTSDSRFAAVWRTEAVPEVNSVTKVSSPQKAGLRTEQTEQLFHWCQTGSSRSTVTRHHSSIKIKYMNIVVDSVCRRRHIRRSIFVTDQPSLQDLRESLRLKLFWTSAAYCITYWSRESRKQ